ASWVVQALPSSHGPVLFACTQPFTGSHASSVQGFLSSQFVGACVQPVPGSHASSVQGSPSPQSGGGPPTHDPSAHVSFVVQALPSSHGPVLFVFVQTPSTHASSVHTLPSSQSTGSLRHPPGVHVSVVQGSASSQAALFAQKGESRSPREWSK